jgi:hypothetical protein
MANRKSFTDYLAEAQARQPMVQAKAKPSQQDPLSWFIDILSRPMRAVENVPNQIFNEMIKADQAKKTGANFDVLGAIGNVATSPLRGFLSTNRADQPTGAELIEKGTDAFGTTFDPNYVDTEENVNPWVAGIGGFGLDVGLDPLTYIPGAQIAKAGQVGLKAVKGIATGADALLAGSNLGKAIGSTARATNRANAVIRAEELAKLREETAAAVEKARQEASRFTPTATAEAAKAILESGRPAASQILKDVKPTALMAPILKGADEAKAKFTETLAKIDGIPATEAELKIGKQWRDRQARQAKKEEGIANAEADANRLLDTAVPTTAKEVAPKASAAIAKATEAIPTSVADQMASQADAFGNVTKKLEEINAATKAVPATPVATDFREWLKAEQKAMKADPVRRIEIPAIGGMPAMSLKSEDITKFLAMKQGPERVRMRDMLMQPWKAAMKAAGTPAEATTYTAYIAKMLKTKKGKAEFEKLFGVKATTQLLKMNENGLQSAVAHLGDVLKGQKTAELEAAMNRKSGGFLGGNAGRFTDAVFQHYGIDIPGTNVRRLQATSEVATPKGEEIKAAIQAGEDMRTAGYLVGVTEAQLNSVLEWLPKFLKDEFLNMKGYRELPNGVWLKKVGNGKEIGKRPWELNSMDQYTMWDHAMRRQREAIKAINDALRESGSKADLNKVIAGYARAVEIADNGLNELRLATNVLDGKGTAFWMGIGEDKFRMDVVQMYTVLDKAATTTIIDGKAGIAREAIKIALMNEETGIPITNIMKAVTELHLRPETTDEQLLAFLKADVPGAKNILNEKTGTYRHYIAKPTKGTEPYSMFFEPNPRHPGMFYGKIDPVRFGDEMIAVIREAAPEISRVAADNQAMVAARHLAEGKDLSMADFERLTAFAKDSSAMGDSIRAAANIPATTSETGALGRTMPTAQQAATITVDNAARADLVAGAKDAVKIEDTARASQNFDVTSQVNDQILREKLKKITYDRFQYDIKYADQLINGTKAVEDGFDAFGNVVDPLARATAVHDLAAEHNMARVLNPMREFFDIRHGAERVVDRYQQSTIQLMRGLQEYNIGLTNVAREFRGFIPGTETRLITQAFRDLANGVDNPATAAAREALKPLVHQVFGSSADNAALESIFIRSGGTIQDMEAYMRKDKIDFPFDLKAARDWTRAGMARSEVEAAIQQWKVVFANAEDPIQLLSQMYHAGAQLASDKVSADLFRSMSGIWSETPKAGFVQIPEAANVMDNPFIGHLPKGSFIEKTYLDEIRQIEKVATSPKTIQFLRNSYMPLLANWKFGVTVLRPGHHVRNFLSSEMIQYVAEGLKHYQKAGNAAFKVLMTHRAYEGVDWLETAKHIGMAEMPKTGDVLFGSKWGDITTDAVYEAAQKKGLMVEYKQSQDVLDEMGGGGLAKRWSDRLLFRGTKVEKIAGGVAEYQTHYNRLHHFNQILMKEANGKRFKNWNDLVEYAAQRVRKHHPDSTMLAPGEAKLRAVIPFYTWFRLIMPRVVEGIATQPGRFMVFPKASFGLATAMGVDPYSLADPFPQDQLFPSFLTDQMTGPVAEINGNYIGMAPGVPYIDLLNQFVGQGPVRGTASMISPFLRIPAELLGGTQWGTGAKIKDFSDYVDSNLPGINYISNITGTSVTGSIVSGASGQGLDAQYAVAAKNKTPFDQFMTASNWLTGLGLQNFSKPNYINYAELEKRNAAAKDQRNPY